MYRCIYKCMNVYKPNRLTSIETEKKIRRDYRNEKYEKRSFSLKFY